MSDDERHELIFSIVHNPTTYQARLQRSNFSGLVEALQQLLGTKRLQAEALRRQMNGMVASSFEAVLQLQRRFGLGCYQAPVLGRQCLAFESALRKICFPILKKYMPKEKILRIWWDLWEEEKDDTIARFRSDPNAREGLLVLFNKLQDAQELPNVLNEPSRICDAMKLLVREKCSVIMDRIREPNSPDFPKWRFSSRDWNNLVESVCLMSCSKVCAKNFGRELANLRNGLKALPNDPDPYRNECVFMPESPSDPNHWGHLNLKVGEYLKHALACESMFSLTNLSQREKRLTFAALFFVYSCRREKGLIFMAVLFFANFVRKVARS